MACPLCPGNSLDPLGVGLSSHLEVGSGWGQESSRTRPADILVTNWDNGISAAFDVTVASPLNSSTIMEAGMYMYSASVTTGVAALTTELRKHSSNDTKCKNWTGSVYH
ncbi:hypothetical protein EMCRGX_G004553 [Ephydatia muelleri]